MKIVLDEDGDAIPDYKCEEYAQLCIDGKLDANVSNMLVIDAFRYLLLKMEKEDRPEIEWVFYGKTVHFDDDLRSHDAWDDDRVNFYEKFLNGILGWN